MELVPLGFEGVFGITSTTSKDERGSFLRVWDSASFGDQFDLNQASTVVNIRAKTLRGLHYQDNPYEETKIVQCVLGVVFDVLVDIREGSLTFGNHVSVQLGPDEKYQGILAPRGFAHGYLTLEPNSTLLYFMDRSYAPEYARGVIWNDPSLHIEWPFEPQVISERDQNFPRLENL